MKRQTILKAWALFGVYWFITFSILTFASGATLPVIILAALSLYAGLILAILSIASLVYERIRLTREVIPKEKAEKIEPERTVVARTPEKEEVYGRIKLIEKASKEEEKSESQS